MELIVYSCLLGDKYCEWFWFRTWVDFGNKQKKEVSAAFTGSTTTGRLVIQYATENIIPVTLELGGKYSNIL
jgi:hypothetical protein